VTDERTLSDDDIRTEVPGSASTVEEERPRDMDGTDTQDQDGTDTADQDGTDSQDTDGVDSQDADGTDQ
jgi:hypothetical protein